MERVEVGVNVWISEAPIQLPAVLFPALLLLGVRGVDDLEDGAFLLAIAELTKALSPDGFPLSVVLNIVDNALDVEELNG